MLRADRDTNHILCDTGADPLLFRELLVSGVPRMDGKRLGVSDAIKNLANSLIPNNLAQHLLGEIRNHLEVVNDLASSSTTTLDAKRENTTETFLQVALRLFMLIVALQTWIRHP